MSTIPFDSRRQYFGANHVTTTAISLHLRNVTRAP